MALQGCRSIEMYRSNLRDISESYGQHYLKLDGKNSIRTVVLRPDLAQEIARYRQARIKSGEKVNADRPLFISLSNRRYGQRLSRRGIGYIVDRYLSRCGLKHSDLRRGCEALEDSQGRSPKDSAGLPTVSDFKSESQVAVHSAPLGKRSLSSHSLRHTAGTLSLQNGASLREVQDLLGHADPKTTAVYTHVINSQENNPASRIDIDF